MEIKRLAGTACKTTRALWEQVFTEDSERFVDYYYEEKAVHNLAYVSGEEPYEAMLFRTPYRVQVYDKIKELSYLVGVATREEFRHKGRMTALLMKAMEEMYSQKNPFTFLMPANPAIYEPFHFRYVYHRPQWIFREESFPVEVLEPLRGTKKKLCLQEGCCLSSLSGCFGKQLPNKEKEEKLREKLEELADFSNQWLAKRYQIYVKRCAEYYRRQLLEIQAQNGDIFLLEKEGGLEGFFLYAREGEKIFIQEMLETIPGSLSFLTEKEEKKPVIMARIIHLEEMMKLMKSPSNRTVLIDVEDPLLPQNDGLYLWELTPYGSRVTRQKEGRKAEMFMTIDELTPHLFQGVFLNEIV